MEPAVVFHAGAEIRASENLTIGRGSIIGDRALLDARNGLVIGENVNFSSDVHIYTEQHDHRDPYFRCNSDADFRVRIGDRAWIGPRTLILHGVTVGEGCAALRDRGWRSGPENRRPDPRSALCAEGGVGFLLSSIRFGGSVVGFTAAYPAELSASGRLV